MSHTTAANLASFFGVRGRVIPTSSACTSGSQGIGYAYEAILHGQQEIMLAGGAEELDTDRCGGLRRAVRGLHPQRRAGAHAAALRSRPRRHGRGRGRRLPRARGARACAPARCADPGRGDRLRHQLRRPPSHAARSQGHGAGDAPGAGLRRPRPGADRLRERPRHRDRGRRHRGEPRHARGLRRAARRSARSRATSRTPWAPAARWRPGSRSR